MNRCCWVFNSFLLDTKEEFCFAKILKKVFAWMILEKGVHMNLPMETFVELANESCVDL